MTFMYYLSKSILFLRYSWRLTNDYRLRVNLDLQVGMTRKFTKQKNISDTK